MDSGRSLFDRIETVSMWSGASTPLHERIQAYIDEVNPQKADPRGPWMPDLRLRTPGKMADFFPGTITVDYDLGDHEALEELPGPCIMCGKDDVHVTVERNADGDIVETTLKCQDCGWRVIGGPMSPEARL